MLYSKWQMDTLYSILYGLLPCCERALTVNVFIKIRNNCHRSNRNDLYRDGRLRVQSIFNRNDLYRDVRLRVQSIINRNDVYRDGRLRVQIIIYGCNNEDRWQYKRETDNVNLNLHVLRRSIGRTIRR